MTGSARKAPERPPAAATIGVFDGVHRGHQALLDRVVSAARGFSGVPVVVTFARHPLAVLAPERCPEPLSTGEERHALLRARGIADVIVLDFDRAMSELTAREFLARVLLGRYDLRVLVAGPDFAMGRHRRGGLVELNALGAELGFAVEQVAPVPALGSPVSSTRLRQAIAAGEVGVARELLGRDYTIGGRVVSGHGRGRGLGYPTANLDVEEGKMLPGDGVYAAFVTRPPAARDSPEAGSPGAKAYGAAAASGIAAGAGGTAAGLRGIAASAGGTSAPARGVAAGAARGAAEAWWPAVVNIGLAPTFGGAQRRVEVHVLDFAEDLRGDWLLVRVIARLRGEKRFPDASALTVQIATDVTRARQLLGAGSLKAGGPPADRSLEG